MTGILILASTISGLNFVTDFGAVEGGGVGSSDAAIIAFNAYMATATGDVVLYIPPGTYNITYGLTTSFVRTASTANSLTISATGVTLTNAMNFGNAFGQSGDNTHQARTATVSAGSSTVTLVTPSDHSLFTVGTWAIMTGLDLQGYGSPTNHQFFEYVLITAKDTVTGVITFSAPLIYSYLSTWPNYYAGSAFATDQGGPATLYAITPGWDMELYVQGIAFPGTQGQTYAKFRHVEFSDCSWPFGTPGPAPTFSSYTLYDSCTISSAGIEVDKLVETLVFDNCTIRSLDIQSASCRDLIVSDCTITNNLYGSGGRDTVITNTTVGASYAWGPYAYGVTLGRITLDTVDIASVNNPAGTGPTYPTTDYTHAGSGVFTIAKPVGASPKAWAIPGARCAVVGSNGQICQFYVTDLAESGGNTVITTDLVGGWPAAPAGWGATTSVAVVQATSLYATACTGTEQMEQISLAGAQGKPLNSYLYKVYQEGFTQSVAIPLVGRLVSFSFNVTLAYAGATTTVKFSPGQFHTFGTLPESSYAAYDFVPSINCKVAGARVFTPGATTGTKSGDTSMTAPPNPAFWFTKQIAPFLTGSVADGTVTVVVEATCDQADSS